MSLPTVAFFLLTPFSLSKRIIITPSLSTDGGIEFNVFLDIFI